MKKAIFGFSFGLHAACTLWLAFGLNVRGAERGLGSDGNGAYATGKSGHRVESVLRKF
jgi:hypothetical protein